MIPRDLALALRDAGLTWTPAHGDRFAVLGHDLDDEVFVLSGTVVEPGDTLWLPREDQLRETLGEAFMALDYLAGETPGYAVTMLLGNAERRFVDVDAEAAYARAVLALLRG